MQAKNTMPRKLETKPNQNTVLGANMSPKIDPGGLRERLGRLLRASSPKALLEASSGEKKFQGRPWEKFPTRLANKSIRNGIGAASVGGVGGARKSLSWRI